MTSDNWKQDPYAKSWLGKVSKRTQENYSATFPKWLSFIKMSPTEQIEKRVRDLQSGDLRERCWFEDKVIEYKNFLATQGYRAVTVRSYLISVQSFFSKNRLKLQFSRGDLKVEETQKVVTKWILDNIEIRAMYSMAGVRDRALLLMLYQSGFSEIDVASLNVEDLRNIYENDGHLYIEKLREKTNQPQRSCISSEAVHDIKVMLRERGNPETGPLFVSQKGKRLSVRFINEAIKNLCVKAHGDKCKLFKTKSLRSSYNDTLLRAEIKQEIKDLMMGHKRAGARGHYECSPTTIMQAYEKTFKYLSINHGAQARKDVARMEDTVIGLSDVVRKQQEEIVKLRTILEQHNIQFQKMTTDFNDRLTWLENKLKKKEKTIFT